MFGKRTTISLKKFIMWVFILRPFIDEFWNVKIVAGMNPAGIISVLLVILTFVYMLSHRVNFRPIAPRCLLCALAIVMSVSYFIQRPVISEMQNFLRLLSSLSVLVILTPSLTEKEFDFMVKGYMICTLIPIVMSFLQLIGIVPYTYWDYINGSYISRASGGYRQPSHLTRYLVFGVMYAFYYLAAKKVTSSNKLLVYIYIALCLAATFISYHRTGYLCMVVLFAIYFLYIFHKNKVKTIITVMAIIIVCVAAFIAAIQSGILELDISGFRSLLNISNVFKFDSDGKFTLVLRGRGSFISTVALNMSNSPFLTKLFGNGGAYNSFTGQLFSVADMDILAIIWNFGGCGALLWGLEILVLINRLCKYRNYKGYDRSYFMLVLMSIVIYLIFGLTIEANFTPNFMYHILLINGYLVTKCKSDVLTGSGRIHADKTTYGTEEGLLNGGTE